jgi:bifunctional DNA-binding transcriptional regulator/antitoxin component of YhaV-PrlF toxin-antitoxin module
MVVRGEINMAVVVIDERGRLTIPSELQVRDTKATLIPAGTFMIIVPLPTKPIDASGGWIRTRSSRKELKALAEKQARKDAVKRAKRRKQL